MFTAKVLKNNFITELRVEEWGGGLKKEIREHVHGFQLICKQRKG